MGDVAVNVVYKWNRIPQVYDPDWLTSLPRQPPPKVAGPFARCEGCPYPGHGFVCWGGERCLRSDMKQVMTREDKEGGGEGGGDDA